MSDTVRF